MEDYIKIEISKLKYEIVLLELSELKLGIMLCVTIIFAAVLFFFRDFADYLWDLEYLGGIIAAILGFAGFGSVLGIFGCLKELPAKRYEKRYWKHMLYGEKRS